MLFFAESYEELRAKLASYQFSDLAQEVERLKKRDEERQAELDKLAEAKGAVEKAAVEAREQFEKLEQCYNKQRQDDQAEITRLKDEVARMTMEEGSARKELARIDLAVRGNLRDDVLVLLKIFLS